MAAAEADNTSTGHTLRTQNLIREAVNQRGRSITDAAITDRSESVSIGAEAAASGSVLDRFARITLEKRRMGEKSLASR